MLDFEVHKNENERQYIWRVGQYVEQGKITWKELAPIINEKWRDTEDEYRDESAYRKPYQSAHSYYEDVFSKMENQEMENNISVQIRELKKERQKLSTEKIEYNKYLREEARDELIMEKICDSIATLPPLDVPEYIQPEHDTRSYLCCFTDSHFGIEFSIQDFYGNIINEYSPEIFEKRMWNLLYQIKEIVEKEDIKELSVWELGDGIQGLLRLNSQLMQLRYGVIDSAVIYGNFLANWLNELSKFVRIKFQMVMDSNHNQLRLCGAPKNSFIDENMSKVIMLAIKGLLKDNPNVSIIENPTGMNFGQFSTYQVLGIHGEVKNIGKALNDYSRAYDTPISYIIGGHCHHSSNTEVGIKAEALSVRSMIGVDPYGMSLNLASSAGANLFEFNYNGLVCDHRLIVD